MPGSVPKRVLVTRSRHQASALATQLEALGIEPILIPTISIAPPANFAALDEAIARRDTFDWIVFTSANAVQAFHERLLLASAKTPGSGRLAVIGPATAKALQQTGLTPDLIPPEAVAESLARALLPHITSGLTRVLLVRAETARDVLPEALAAAGATLTIAPSYRNVIPQGSVSLLQALFATPATWPDAITFTSSSTATNLLALLDAARLILPQDGDSGRTVLRASIGPITSQTLRELGYPPHLESPEPNVPSLVQALVRRLHSKRS